MTPIKPGTARCLGLRPARPRGVLRFSHTMSPAETEAFTLAFAEAVEQYRTIQWIAEEDPSAP